MEKICRDEKIGNYNVPVDAKFCIDGSVPEIEYCVSASEYIDNNVRSVDDMDGLRQFYREVGAGSLAAIPVGRVAQVSVKAYPKVANFTVQTATYIGVGTASRNEAFISHDDEPLLVQALKLPFAVAEDAGEWIGMNATRGAFYAYSGAVAVGDRLLGTGVTCEGQGIFPGDERFPTTLPKVNAVDSIDR